MWISVVPFYIADWIYWQTKSQWFFENVVLITLGFVRIAGYNIPDAPGGE